MKCLIALMMAMVACLPQRRRSKAELLRCSFLCNQ